MHNNAIGLILAGGSGKRLWPLSNEKHPKQLSSEIFDGSLLNETVRRAKEIFLPENIYILTLESQKEEIEKVCDLENILIQPKNADTASAFCMASIYFSNKFPDKVVSVLFSDHIVPYDEEFIETISLAIEVAEKSNKIVCIGSTPNYPNTNFGYIRKGDKLSENVYEVKKYVEKPSKELAENMVRSEDYLWNSGYFTFKPNVLEKEFSILHPDFYKSFLSITDEILANIVTDKSREVYNSVQHESVEHFIIEKSSNLCVVESTMKWKDIGSWEALYGISKKDDNLNAVIESESGNTLVVDSNGSVIYPGDNNILVIGVDNLVIASVDNNVLVCKRSDLDKIKKYIKKLERLPK